MQTPSLLKPSSFFFICPIFLLHFPLLSPSLLQMQDHTLTALVVFRNFIYPELIRSVHVYRLEGGEERVVEREYVFHSRGNYEEIGSSRVITLEKFPVSAQFKGLVNGVWLCIYVFDADRPLASHQDDIPTILMLRDSKLLSVPTLANDLKRISQLTHKVEDGKKLQTFVQETGSLDNAGELPSTSQQTFALDLNSFPPELAYEESDEQSGAGKKKRRAAPKAISQLTLADLAKYFDLPIAEAAKNLKVGVTVLKKRCRELGIPRWPHRKIKSLDGLIQDLQNEVAQQQTDEATAMIVAQRQMMLQNEKDNMERKPFMEIQLETKRFRQDIFKKRHRAKARELQI